MPRGNQGKPLAILHATGQVANDPKRYAGRQVPRSTKLGDPPDWFSEEQCVSWELTLRELPYLKESHRSAVEVFCIIRTDIRDSARNEIPISNETLTQFRQYSVLLGGNPTSESRVALEEGEGTDDPNDFYN